MISGAPISGASLSSYILTWIYEVVRMADQDVAGAIEDGTYATDAPNPHVNLAGTSPSGYFIDELFVNVLSNSQTCSVTVRKDADNWASYKNVTFTTGSPNILDLSGATAITTKGTLANSDTVIAMVIMPNWLPDPTNATDGAYLAVSSGQYVLVGG